MDIAQKYLACYGSNGLPAAFFPPFLLLPASFFNGRPAGSIPLVVAYNMSYIPDASAPRPYNLDCLAVSWRLVLATVTVAVIVVISAYFAVRR